MNEVLYRSLDNCSERTIRHKLKQTDNHRSEDNKLIALKIINQDIIEMIEKARFFEMI